MPTQRTELTPGCLPTSPPLSRPTNAASSSSAPAQRSAAADSRSLQKTIACQPWPARTIYKAPRLGQSRIRAGQTAIIAHKCSQNSPRLAARTRRHPSARVLFPSCEEQCRPAGGPHCLVFLVPAGKTMSVRGSVCHLFRLRARNIYSDSKTGSVPGEGATQSNEKFPPPSSAFPATR